MIKGYKWRNIEARRDTLNKLVSGSATILVFDTETTGLADPQSGITEEEIKIIQFSGILYSITLENGCLRLKQEDFLNLYVNPGELLSEEVTELTGITDKMLSSADSEEMAAWKIASFMGKSKLWAAYNAPYDVKRLQGLRQRTGIPFLLPGEGANSPTAFDVLSLARDMVDPASIASFKKEKGIHKRGAYKLEILTPMLMPEFEASFHNSLDDVKATAMLLATLYPPCMEATAPTGTGKIQVKKFSYDIASPYNALATRRIVVYTEPKDKKDGAFAEKSGIYWDVSGSVWSCEADAKSKALFKSTDLSDVEAQVLSLAAGQGYAGGNEYRTLDMDTLHIEAAKRFVKTPAGQRKLALIKRISKERALEAKGSQLESLFTGIEVE